MEEHCKHLLTESEVVNVKEFIAKFVVNNKLPFHIVDQPIFLWLMDAMCPHTSTVLPKKQKQHKIAWKNYCTSKREEDSGTLCWSVCWQMGKHCKRTCWRHNCKHWWVRLCHRSGKDWHRTRQHGNSTCMGTIDGWLQCKIWHANFTPLFRWCWAMCQSSENSLSELTTHAVWPLLCPSSESGHFWCVLLACWSFLTDIFGHKIFQSSSFADQSCDRRTFEGRPIFRTQKCDHSSGKSCDWIVKQVASNVEESS